MPSGYRAFLDRRRQVTDHGFAPHSLPNFLFPFQRAMTEWAVRKGRAAIFADCGLGKTPMQLVWADNVVRHTGRPVLILTPLAVSHQLVREGDKFGICVERRRVGAGPCTSTVQATNYQRLHHFDPSEYSGIVCDESSILKSFNGVTRRALTEFMRQIPYRLLCTATAAPNDHTELGTSSEALGHLGSIDMLQRFFTQARKSTLDSRSIGRDKWRFKGHAETSFWRWVCSWARAARRPSDLGFDDTAFVLPELIEREHIVKSETLPDGYLFPMAAHSWQEQRAERRRTIKERCEKAAELVEGHDRSVVWCHLNDEADLLERIIPGAVQVAGSDCDEHKEEALRMFADGEIRRLVTKPKIGAWGLNFQRCAHIVTFTSHSYEQYYQSIRRCWRFGQKRPVTVDLVATEGEANVTASLRRKARAADRMFTALVREMNDARAVDVTRHFPHNVETPQWLTTN